MAIELIISIDYAIIASQDIISILGIKEFNVGLIKEMNDGTFA